MGKVRAIAGKGETELHIGDWPLATGRIMPKLLHDYQHAMPNVRDFQDPAFRARASTDTIVSVVMAGKGQMPAFANSMSLPKMQALSGYIRRLGTASAPPGAAP